MIGSVHIPYFAATLYALNNTLPFTTPLALVVNDSIYALNAPAEQAGLRRHMPEREARSRVPEVLFRPAQPMRDAETIALMLDCIQHHTDTLDPVTSPHMPFIQMAMPVKRRADQIEVAQQIGRTIREQTTLTPAFAIAPVPFTARTTARVTPVGNVRYVEAGRDKALLARCPVSLLPLSGEVLRRLHRLGITTIGQFAALPPDAVLHQFGASVNVAHAIANGRDPSPLRPLEPPPAFKVAHTFTDPISYRQPLEAVLSRMSDRLAAQLRASRFSTSLIRLVVMTEDGTDYEKKAPLRDPLRESRDINATLTRLLRLVPVASGVVQIEAVAEGLGSPVAAFRQSGFFDHLYPKGMLERFFPQLLQRYGQAPFWRVVFRADREGYLPEEQFDLIPF
jgi:nucleotidyltransferase/DNA polymerase involved in DNA repair